MRELALYAVNTSQLYFGPAKEAMCQVAALLNRGTYSAAKEVVIWRRYVHRAFLRYVAEVGRPDANEPMHRAQYVDACAAEVANYYREELRDVYKWDLCDLKGYYYPGEEPVRPQPVAKVARPINPARPKLTLVPFWNGER